MIRVPAWLELHRQALVTAAAGAGATVLAVIAALLAHRLLVALLRRAAARTRTRADDLVIRGAERPARWILVVVAAGLAQHTWPLSPWAAEIWRQALGFVLPALFGWLAVSIVRAVEQVIMLRADISVENNLQARRRRTRVNILTRISAALILFLTACMMLLSIPGVRNVGVTLMASAGLAGLVVGAAAQPALKNLIAGVQLAFTEPIRIDDVVIIAGEWGRIEEIQLTYVVVKVWDERRLVVPVSKFLEEPFQNWTRDSAQLTGAVLFYLDPTTDVQRLRGRLQDLVTSNRNWDGRFWNLQVTDIKQDLMEVRALVTAADAGRAFDLRCDVREGLMRFISEQMPQALPRHRLEPPLVPEAPVQAVH